MHYRCKLLYSIIDFIEKGIGQIGSSVELHKRTSVESYDMLSVVYKRKIIWNYCLYCYRIDHLYLLVNFYHAITLHWMQLNQLFDLIWLDFCHQTQEWGCLSPSFLVGYLPRKRCEYWWWVLMLLVKLPSCTSSSWER